MSSSETTKKGIWRTLLPAALQSIFAWKLVMRELLGVSLIWGAWFMIKSMIPAMEANGGDVQFFKEILPFFKSILPAALILAVSVILDIAGIFPWHLWALMAAGVASVIYAVGFTIHGGNGRLSIANQER